MGIEFGYKVKKVDSGSTVVAAPRKRLRQPNEVKARVLQSALNLFAESGYDGASVRAIAEDAGVSISLLIHHFKSKEALWKMVIHEVFTIASAAVHYDDERQDVTARERLREIISRTVHVFAKYPSVHRLMTLEGHQLTERLTFIMENYLKADARIVCKLIQAAQMEGAVRAGEPARLRQAIIAMAAVPFSVSAEYQYLTKKSPFTQKEVNATIDLINQLIFK